MKDTELRRERDKALYETYLRGLKEQHFVNMHEAAEWVRNQPAPKYYISSKSLSNYIGALLTGGYLPKLHDSTFRKVVYLYLQYVEFVTSNPDCKLSRDKICEILVDEPAPRFYITHDSTLCILTSERKRQRQEFLKRLSR